jgi:outer membrane protein W
MAVPVVVTSVYQLTAGGTLRPYVGAGATVLFTTKAKVTNPLLIEVGHPELKISPAPGLVGQAGLDIRLWRSWYARLDVKFIALKAHAEVNHVEVRTPGLPLFDSVEVGTAKLDVWVNPLIVQAGVGCDFDIVDLVHKLTGGS